MYELWVKPAQQNSWQTLFWQHLCTTPHASSASCANGADGAVADTLGALCIRCHGGAMPMKWWNCPKERFEISHDLTKCWVSEVYKFDWKRVVSSWLSENGGISYVYRCKWVGIRRISRRFILEAVMDTRPGASLLEARERFRALWSEWWYHCITYSFGAFWVSKFVKAGTRGYSIKM